MSDPIPPSDRAATGRAGKVKARAREELRRFLVIALYLWVVFGLLTLHQGIILSEHGINYSAHGVAIINALVFAKVMLVAEDLRLGSRRRENRPLIDPILYRSAVFAIVLVCFHLLEKLAGGLLVGEKVSQIFPGLQGGPVLGWRSVDETLSAAAIATIALVPYFAYRELGRVIGEDRLSALFFKSGPKGPAPG